MRPGILLCALISAAPVDAGAARVLFVGDAVGAVPFQLQRLAASLGTAILLLQQGRSWCLRVTWCRTRCARPPRGGLPSSAGFIVTWSLWRSTKRRSRLSRGRLQSTIELKASVSDSLDFDTIRLRYTFTFVTQRLRSA